MIRRFERAWPVAAVDSLAVMQTTTMHDSAGGALTVRRIGWGQYLVTATAPAGMHQVRKSALFERLDFERGMQEAAQVIVASAPVSAPAARFLVDSSSCALPGARLPADTLAAIQPDYAFAGLSWDGLASVADTGLVFSAAGFTVASGAFAGILVVRGTVTLQNGADFNGVIIVEGDVVIEDNVRMTGALIVRGSGSVSVGAAQLTHSPCQVARALLQTPAARRLARSHRRFIPAF